MVDDVPADREVPPSVLINFGWSALPAGNSASKKTANKSRCRGVVDWPMREE